jgi:acyl-CoA hydrolase
MGKRIVGGMVMGVFQEAYVSKKTTLDNVLNLVRSDQVIVTGMCCMEAQDFLSQLHTISHRVRNVQVYTCLNMKEYEFYKQPEFVSSFMNNSWFHSAGIRKALKQGIRNSTYVPNNLHEAGTNLLSLGDPDIYIGMVSPMDEHGFFSLSLSVTYEKDIIEKAKTVIVEVNPRAPRTHGDTQIHISEIDHLYEVNYPIPTLPDSTPSETEKGIADHIAGLIENGSTLQIGIGGIPNAVCKLLMDKREIGIHTEMFTESMIDLFEAGVITNRQKTLWKGKAVCTFALGSEKMYHFVDDNPGVWLLRGNYVNDPYVICQNKKMVSVNTALMVDLTGQVCSEGLGTTHYSGTGGQLDTHRGASMSEGGKGIIALESSTKKRESKIVPIFQAGSPVTVPRHDLDWVVTEYGAVRLRGKPVNQRAEMLIGIAHPDHRERLRKEAQAYGLI